VVVAHDPVHTLFLIPGGGTHPGLPGNYLYGSVQEHGNGSEPGQCSLQVHDSFDGVMLSEAPTLKAALEQLLEVVQSAPFHLNELEALGFRVG
jgi:hypothetical protein